MLVTDSVAMLPADDRQLDFAVYGLCMLCTYMYMTYVCVRLMNSTSLIASEKLLLYLYVSTFVAAVLKLALMLTLLRPPGSKSGGTEAIYTCGVLVCGASQTLKSSGTA